MSIQKDHVRRMTHFFENINIDSKQYGNGHETSFKNCKWWSKIPPKPNDHALSEEHSSSIELTDIYRVNNDKIENGCNTSKSIEHNYYQSDTFICDTDALESSDIAQILNIENINLNEIQQMQLNETNDYHNLSKSDNSINSCSFLNSTSILSNTSHDSNLSSQVTNTIEELLVNEANYINKLNQGINDYMNRFDRKNMPARFRGQKYHVFGNILQIKDFHERIFYPALKQCEMNIFNICKIFRNFIERGYFYIYILYAINRQLSEKIYEVDSDYFKKLQSEVHDMLGVNSFLVQPIQRLPKYKLLLGQLVKELGKRSNLRGDIIKKEITECRLAEKQLQRLLDILNGAMKVNDIIDCNELHVLCQGKFMLVDKFDICEKKQRYKGEVFLFENCIIYTEILSKEKYLYRGHFRQVSLGFTFRDRYRFTLYNERKGNQEIEFTADAQTISYWVEMINSTMASVIQFEKEKLKKSRNSSIQMNSNAMRIPEVLQSTNKDMPKCNYSLTHTLPKVSKVGCQREKGYTIIESNLLNNTSRSMELQAWNQTLCTEQKLVERFLNSEKYYIQRLQKGKMKYLADLSQELHSTLTIYLTSINSILKFHSTKFYPKLLDCNMDTRIICELMKFHIDAADFNIYVNYAAFVTEALSIIEKKFRNNDQRNLSESNNDEIKQFFLLPIQHIDNYADFLNNLLKDKYLLTDEFKVFAASEIEMKKLQKLVWENFNINSMKLSTNVVRKFGLISYSDEVSIDFSMCRLLVLEKGLVCVRIKTNKKTQKEKFLEQLFCISILNIGLHENDAYPKMIKIVANSSNNVNYTIGFTTIRKKKQFLEAIRTIKSSV